ncbi:xaa-Pro aminopeptidase 3-like [Schistocerca gregaria]|uniref:xaa-Pro aminopeptidase 3-like n=1 Tax=Schistocerca gregaria TaxID=7010 RepID=UPI00211E17B1|nr:xaa-Pro aminopeptidase 3-like [Schistocerca gregaria]
MQSSVLRVLKSSITQTGNETQRIFYGSYSRYAVEKGSDMKEKTCGVIGQPTHVTHPHLLKNGEVLPGLCIQEFQERRQKLLSSILRYEPNLNHVIVIPSATKMFMTEKIPYPFRQNSDFLYLTGCLEPECALVMSSHSGKSKSVLFLRNKDPQAELWDGPRTGIDAAPSFFGVDEALHIRDLGTFLQSYAKGTSSFYLWYEYIQPVQPNLHKVMRDYLNGKWNKTWSSPRPFIHRLRLYKSDAEINLMKTSCEIASKAIATTMSITKNCTTEHELQAHVDFECRLHGAQQLAYPPVVAGGDRANIIHYINNDQVLRDGDMVLMDAGCEYHGYCSDITRTWPVSGKFSDEQQVLYEALLEVQMSLIQHCSTFPPLDALFHHMCTLIREKLIAARVISQSFRNEDGASVGFSLCPHHVSHYLGMDVHDTPLIARSIRLEPRMTVTVEPGIYIKKNNKMIVPEFRGLGIRIEDDVLITEDGPVVLTSSCPKHTEDIEKTWPCEYDCN